MRLLQHAAELNAGNRGASAAIGVFDGVHLGHREIVRCTVEAARELDAEAVVVTFDRHPNAVVAPDRVPPRIGTLESRLESLAALGVDAVLLIRFDAEFSRQSGEAFIRSLAAGFGRIRNLCVGADFTFGHRRSGNLALLESLGVSMGFRVQGLAPVTVDGAPVSSTRIRELIRAGDLPGAGRLLGRPYALGGRVMEGDRLGRKLGFPTANLDVAGMVLPPNGVYAGTAALSGARHPAVMNLGLRPTVGAAEPSLRAEVHLLDFSGDLYGRNLEFEPVAKLRDEMKFGSLQELETQIARDVQAARQRL
ncbi:MAG: bifunctional riboflavin kinase/FAD synthetase [Verrucomicrobiota bacterium]